MKTLTNQTKICKALLSTSLCLVMANLAVPQSAMAEERASEPIAVAMQQQTNVTGRVVDGNGEPIVGVTILEKGTTNGTVTDVDGRYTINVSNTEAVLIFNFIGYELQEIVVGNQSNINVTLNEESKFVDEIYVIGYGTAKKGDLTSAVASIKEEDFAAGKISDAAELIKGKVAGLSITKASGDPTTENSIMLRGVTTITGSVSPLILIDGVEGSLSDVAPENISAIDVLKDASAAAIYGTRGANGVIIISTKQGKREQALQASYSGYMSFSNWSKKADFMDANDIRNGLTSFSDEGYETDWLDEVSNKYGFTQNHSITLSGGSKNSAYAGNISYSKEEGIMRKSDNENIRLQLDISHFCFNDIVKFNLNALVRQQNYTLNHNNFVYRQAIIRNPTAPVYNADGSYNENFNKLYYYNPVSIQNEYTGDARVRSYRLTGNVTVEPIHGWKTNLMLSRDEYHTINQNYTSADYYDLYQKNQSSEGIIYKVVDAEGKVQTRNGTAALLTTDTVVYSYEDTYNGYAGKSHDSGCSDNLELTSNYKFELGSNRFDLLVGYSYLYNEYDGFNAGNGNFPTEQYSYNNLGAGTYVSEHDRHASVGSYKNDNKLIGFFGRLSYAFSDRYNLLVSLRHEGSSKFGADHKWGNFPSISAGWNIANEDFMSNVSVLDQLKLRIGYGITGVIPSDSYLSQNAYTYDSYGDVLSKEGNWVKTLQQTQNPNKELKWETTNEFNVGLDWSILSNRISGSVDFYVKTTKDLLYYYNVPVPPNLYTETLANVGEMRNTGFEILINAIPIRNEILEWSTTLTLSGNRNKLVSLSNDLYETESFHEVGGLGEPISTATHCMEEGHRLGDFWGLKSCGVSKNGFVYVEVKDSEGNPTVKEFNTNLNVQENRQRLGNGMPKMYFGWNNTFRYKGFDLSLQFTGQFGFDILNAQRCFYENNSCSYNRLKSAANTYGAVKYNKETGGFDTVIDKTTNEQKQVKLSKSMSQGFWSDHIEKGDFLKLTNATLGYTLPLKGAVLDYINDVRFYVSTQNVFCITSYSGIDPEVDNYFLAPGIDYQDKYPTVRSFSFGVNLKF